MNPKINYDLWVIMKCQCRLINFNECTTLVGDVDNGGGYACARAESKGEVSIPSSQFCCESNTALKKSLFLKKDI